MFRIIEVGITKFRKPDENNIFQISPVTVETVDLMST